MIHFTSFRKLNNSTKTIINGFVSLLSHCVGYEFKIVKQWVSIEYHVYILWVSAQHIWFTCSTLHLRKTPFSLPALKWKHRYWLYRGLSFFKTPGAAREDYFNILKTLLYQCERIRCEVSFVSKTKSANHINTLKAERFGCKFADAIFKYIFQISILLNTNFIAYVLRGSADNISALVQDIARHRWGHCALPGPMWTYLTAA